MSNDFWGIRGVTLLVVAGAACSGGGGGMTVAQFCESLGANECGATGSAGVADRCLVDATVCKAKRAATCMTWAAAIQQASPAARPFTAGNTKACLDKATSVYKKAIIVPADTDALADVCERVFAGAKKKGDTCSSDYECADATSICDPVFSVCATKSPIVKGDFCGTSPGATCGMGLYCALPDGQTVKMCTDRKMAGDTCDAANPCLETLRCLAGTCAAGLTVGQSCAENSDCAAAAPYCDSYVGSVCDTGFIPSPNNLECATFGASPTGGGAGGASGAGGAADAAGGAGGAG